MGMEGGGETEVKWGESGGGEGICLTHPRYTDARYSVDKIIEAFIEK